MDKTPPPDNRQLPVPETKPRKLRCDMKIVTQVRQLAVAYMIGAVEPYQDLCIRSIPIDRSMVLLINRASDFPTHEGLARYILSIHADATIPTCSEDRNWDHYLLYRNWGILFINQTVNETDGY